ncbi:MAG: choice-of-anchor L domain-containing protein, partial [Gammaproteobacteria bacterium]|nr:choice-of-anchor L domain-containing protein [Gammaproteobacteria bacterium]
AGEAAPIGLPSGVVISTGLVSDAQAAGDLGSKKGTDIPGADEFLGVNPLIGEGDSNRESSVFNKDMVLLEFDLIPANGDLRVDFVFASEEYEKLSQEPDRTCGTGGFVNDRFGIFVGRSNLADANDYSTEQNLAVWSEGDIIDTKSLHRAENFCGADNPWAYVSNHPVGLTNYKTSFDGFSVPLAGQVSVDAGSSYRVRIAIADVGDSIYDSAVFIRYFSSPGSPEAPEVSYPFGQGKLSTNTPDGSIVASITDPSGPIEGVEVTTGPISGTELMLEGGNLHVSGAHSEGDKTFQVAVYDYISWHPCDGTSTFNPCDYNTNGYLNDASRSPEISEVALSFSNMAAAETRVTANKAEASISDTIIVTVRLRDADSNALVSGGDSVVATSSLGTINGETGVAQGFDQGDGTYQFTLASSEAGETKVLVVVDGDIQTPIMLTVRFTMIADADGDTIPDSVECTFFGLQLCGVGANTDIDIGIDINSVIDSDRDGLPDYMDPDSDNDGLPDRLEAGDDPFHPVDSDGDGGEDFRDEDSDNDGWSDTQECPNPTNCADLDGNGIPDYRDRARDVGDGESLGVIKTQTSGSGGLGGISVGVLFLMLGIRLRRKAGFFFFGLPLLVGVNAQEASAQSGAFYTGFNLGVSSLDPDTSGAPSLATDDNQDVVVKLNFGYDISEHFSVDAFWVDLGEATFLPVGRLSYEAVGLGLTAHLSLFEESRTYGSGSVYMKSGVVSLLNSSTELEFENNNSVSLYYGLGTEYWLSDHWSIHLEITTYDQDAMEVSAGVAYRFSSAKVRAVADGKPKRHFADRLVKVLSNPAKTVESIKQGVQDVQSKITHGDSPAARKPEPVVVDSLAPIMMGTPEPVIVKPIEDAPHPTLLHSGPGAPPSAGTNNIPATVPEAPVKVTASDEDGDGVLDRNDQCPYTPKEVQVGADGCAEYKGIWREIN